MRSTTTLSVFILTILTRYSVAQAVDEITHVAQTTAVPGEMEGFGDPIEGLVDEFGVEDPTTTGSGVCFLLAQN